MVTLGEAVVWGRPQDSRVRRRHTLTMAEPTSRAIARELLLKRKATASQNALALSFVLMAN